MAWVFEYQDDMLATKINCKTLVKMLVCKCKIEFINRGMENARNLMFLNLRGDGFSHVKQCKFLCKVSSILSENYQIAIWSAIVQLDLWRVHIQSHGSVTHTRVLFIHRTMQGYEEYRFQCISISVKMEYWFAVVKVCFVKWLLDWQSTIEAKSKTKQILS